MKSFLGILRTVAFAAALFAVPGAAQADTFTITNSTFTFLPYRVATTNVTTATNALYWSVLKGETNATWTVESWTEESFATNRVVYVEESNAVTGTIIYVSTVTYPVTNVSWTTHYHVITNMALSVGTLAPTNSPLVQH